MIERPHYYVAKFVNAGLAAGFSELGVEVQTDSDAPFRAYGLALYGFNADGSPVGAAGNVTIKFRFTLPDGTTWFERNLVSGQGLNPFDAQAANGAGGEPAPFYTYFSPLHPNMLYPAQSSITFDFSDLAGETTAVYYAVLVGTKCFPPSAVWAPSYPSKYIARPYFGYALQLLASGIPVNDLPLTIQPDADFVWQCSAQTQYPGAAFASLFVAIGEVAYFTLTAVTAGVGGNAITFAMTGFGTPSLPLVVSVIGDAISVQLATDGGGVATSTRDDVVAALMATPAVVALVTITPVGFSGLIVANYGPTHLFGGAGAGGAPKTRGIGVRFKDWSGKYYMNDFVPLELLFGFDNSQHPGLVYPEIYLPKNQQLYFDFVNLFATGVLSGTLTLGLKGLKVYS